MMFILMMSQGVSKGKSVRERERDYNEAKSRLGLER